MTREEAKILLPIIKAWSEGETLQFKVESGNWLDGTCVTFERPVSCYRIKPKPTMVRMAMNKSSGIIGHRLYIEGEPLPTCWKWVSDPIELYPEAEK